MTRRLANTALAARIEHNQPPASQGRHTALIAGYTGAVGGALARELAGRTEWRVYGLARRPLDHPEPAGQGAPADAVEPPGTGMSGVTGVAADIDRPRRAAARDRSRSTTLPTFSTAGAPPTPSR